MTIPLLYGNNGSLDPGTYIVSVYSYMYTCMLVCLYVYISDVQILQVHILKKIIHVYPI